MAEPKVLFVHLRRPRSAAEDPEERRDDPFYEFGSFGCTGCHSSNLFNPRHAEDLAGARLAFVQGGPLGFRLVFLSPPVTVQKWHDRCEARWTPADMPFKYSEAPVLAYNKGRSDFPLVDQFARRADRTTVEGGVSSRLRSRVQPLPAAMAKQLISVYEHLRDAAPDSAFAATYDEALPYPPPVTDRDRESTYQRRISQLAGGDDRSGSVAGEEAPKAEGMPPSGCRRSRCGRRKC